MPGELSYCNVRMRLASGVHTCTTADLLPAAQYQSRKLPSRCLHLRPRRQGSSLLNLDGADIKLHDVLVTLTLPV